MNLEKLQKAGIYFDYCCFAVVPEVPYAQDVLFTLRRTTEQKYYDFCCNNHSTYIVNVALVVAAVGYEVLNMEPYNEAEAQRIIARAILELCPLDARCLFNSAFLEAKVIVSGKEILPKLANAETIRQLCGCLKCREPEYVWRDYFWEDEPYES